MSGEHLGEIAAVGEQRAHIHLLARYALMQREHLAHGVPRAPVQAIFLRQEVEIAYHQRLSVFHRDFGETDALAFALDVLRLTHAHGQDRRLAHLRDERRTGVDFGRFAALAAARALRQDAHQLVSLQHVRRAFNGGAVGRIALDGERAHAREDLPRQAVGVAEQRVAAHQTHELARTRRHVHKHHVQKRRVVGNHHRTAAVLERAKVLAPVHAIAEQHLEHEADQHIREVREPMRDLLLVGGAAERAVPHVLVFQKQAHTCTPFSWASVQMRSMICSMVRPVESICTASGAGLSGLVSREESMASRRSMSASTSA